MIKFLFVLSMIASASAMASAEEPAPARLQCTVLTVNPQTYQPETISCNDGKTYRILDDGTLQELGK